LTWKGPWAIGDGWSIAWLAGQGSWPMRRRKRPGWPDVGTSSAGERRGPIDSRPGGASQARPIADGGSRGWQGGLRSQAWSSRRPLNGSGSGRRRY
jgi:hypothetical protein